MIVELWLFISRRKTSNPKGSVRQLLPLSAQKVREFGSTASLDSIEPIPRLIRQ